MGDRFLSILSGFVGLGMTTFSLDKIITKSTTTIAWLSMLAGLILTILLIVNTIQKIISN